MGLKEVFAFGVRVRVGLQQGGASEDCSIPRGMVSVGFWVSVTVKIGFYMLPFDAVSSGRASLALSCRLLVAWG